MGLFRNFIALLLQERGRVLILIESFLADFLLLPEEVSSFLIFCNILFYCRHNLCHLV